MIGHDGQHETLNETKRNILYNIDIVQYVSATYPFIMERTNYCGQEFIGQVLKIGAYSPPPPSPSSLTSGNRKREQQNNKKKMMKMKKKKKNVHGDKGKN
ncbi:hypothetical protein BLOT_016707 [Blomia tropicalis]|nr:hypothetical protein BLOT_016707 [Blomia tropicalis]